MFARLLTVNNGAVGLVLFLAIPFFTLVPVSNPIVSLILLFMICLLPGMAILEIFRFSFNSLTTRFFYAALFSILLLMALFTLYSVIAYSLGAVAPLSAFPVRIICLIILLPSITFLLRRLAASNQTSLKSFKWSIFVPRLIALLLPVISLICVLRLNSFSDGNTTIVFLILLILAFLILMVNPAVTPDNNLQAWFIFGISSALVLGSTFRGDGGFWGFDINSEFFSASKIMDQGFWVPPKKANAYQSMLSITVLPVVLSFFAKFSLTLIFKIFYALVLALIPTVLYVWCVKYVSRFSAMVVTGSLILGSISYIPQLTALNRQIIGIAFFIGIFLVISEDSWTWRRKKVVGLFSASGMAVSHYATAYLASAIFAFSVFLALFFFVVSRKRRAKIERVFTSAFCISLVLVTVFWNGVVNQTLQGLKPLAEIALSQGFDFLPNQNQSLWTRWFSGTVPTSDASTSTLSSLESLREYNIRYGKQIRITPTEAGLGYNLQPASIPKPEPIFGSKVAATYGNLIIFGRTFFQLFAAFGLLLLFRRYKKNSSSHRTSLWIPNTSQSLDLVGVGIGALIIGLIARISGTLEPLYNPERAGLQIVIVLMIPSVLAIESVLFRRKIIQLFLAIPVLFFVAVLLIQATSLGGYISGSDTSRISNLQSDYSPFNISESERRASRWLADNVSSSSYLQTDNRGFLALFQNGRRSNSTSLDPVNLAGNSYIYASNYNTVGQIARGQTLFAFPEDYLNQNYHLIYSSSRARIYH